MRRAGDGEKSWPSEPESKRTPHSLRAAFAVRFRETHPGELEALQRLMGHSKIETTQIYLRRYNDERAMERVGTVLGAPIREGAERI